MVGAAIGALATWILRLEPGSARIAVAVVEAFGMLLLVVAMATRWILTREVRAGGVLAACVLATSLLMTLRSMD